MRVGVSGWGWPSSSSVVQSRVAFLAVVEESTKLSFSSRGEDHFHYGSEIEDGAIEDVRICFVTKVEVASLLAVGSDSIEVGGVAVKL